VQSETTVFVVDDDAAARESVRALVEPMGVHSELFASAEEFLKAYDPSRPGCLVTDLRLMGMSGLELLQKLADKNARFPVIVITGHADVPVAVQAMQHGAVTLLEKPCPELELWEAIRKALARDAETREREARRRAITERIACLTPEERAVMDRLIAGQINKVIASELGVSLRTVELRRHNVLRKMEADSLATLVRMVLQARELA